jgi:hypothetical protein
MNQNCADAGDLRGLHYAKDGIAKESGTGALAMRGFIDCEAPV